MVIVFEGIDGSGKTTLSKEAVRIIRKKYGLEAYWFSEPSERNFGLLLKTAILSNLEKLTSFEQTLLFTADRTASIRNEILPLIKQNKIVVMDRSFVSTYAYQIMNTEDKKIRKILTMLTELSIENFQIDYLFYLKCDVGVALGRRKRRDKIEERGDEYMAKIQRNYEEFLDRGHDRIRSMVMLDTTGDLVESIVKLDVELDRILSGFV